MLPASAADDLLSAFFQQDSQGDPFFPFLSLEKKGREKLAGRQRCRQSMIERYLRNVSPRSRQQQRDTGFLMS